MEEHQKLRLIDASAAFNTGSKQQWKRTELLSKGLFLLSRVVTQWETETYALPSALLHHRFPDEFNTHRFQRYCDLASTTCSQSRLSPRVPLPRLRSAALLARSVQKSSLPARHTPRTSHFGLLSPSGTKHKSLTRSKVHLTDWGSQG